MIAGIFLYFYVGPKYQMVPIRGHPLISFYLTSSPYNRPSGHRSFEGIETQALTFKI